MEDSEVLEMISNQQLINALWRTYEEANNILNNTCLYHIRPNPTHALIAALHMLLKRWIYRKGNTTEERLREQLFVKQIYQHYNNRKLPDISPTEEGVGNIVAEEDDSSTNKDDILGEWEGEIVESEGLKCELAFTETTVVRLSGRLGAKDLTERDDTMDFVTRDGDM